MIIMQHRDKHKTP